MNKKSMKFKEFLADKDINCFKYKEVSDEFRTVVFDSYLEIKGDKLPVIIINDISIYTVIRVMVLKKINLSKLNELLKEINRLNGEYKAFKYYISGDKLYLDICIPCDKENFNSEITYTLLDVLLKHLLKEYINLKGYINI